MIKNIKNKVILISSSNFKIYAELPMGLMTVATILQQQYGLLPTILDLPQESSEDSCITEFVNNLGVDEDTLFVGFSTVCDTIPRSFSVARILKQRYPDIPIVFGGPHTTLTAADAIKHYDFIDVIVCGEAEPVLGSLIESIRNNTNKSIPGLIFRSDPDFNKLNLQGLMAPLIPIDSLPQIDYDLYPDSWGEEELPIEAGRGCPFGCTFCSTKDFFKRRFRIKTPETIVGEIRSIIEKRGKIKFRFIHDMISTNRKLLVGICQELIKQNLGMKWRCTARSDMLDRELLELMREAGCYRIMVGLDSGSERMQKLIDKNLPIEKSIQAIRTAMEMSYTISISIIVGFPQEEKRDFIDTINLTLKLVSMGIKLLAVRLFTPYPETQLTREYFPRLQYDDKAVNNARLGKLTVWEETQIKSNPYMFSSFYYIPNPFTPRHVYDFFLWIFFYEPYFRNFLGHLWLNQNEKAGAGLLQWAESNADQIMSRLNPDKLPESLPLMADSFKKFIRDTISDPELAKLLEKMLFFDLLTARNLPDSSALKELAGMLFNTHAKTKESLDNTAKQLLLTTQ